MDTGNDEHCSQCALCIPDSRRKTIPIFKIQSIQNDSALINDAVSQKYNEPLKVLISRKFNGRFEF